MTREDRRRIEVGQAVVDAVAAAEPGQVMDAAMAAAREVVAEQSARASFARLTEAFARAGEAARKAARRHLEAVEQAITSRDDDQGGES